MRGSLPDCLVERGLSRTWAPASALPPLRTDGALAHLTDGPSRRLEGPCLFVGVPSLHGRRARAVPADPPGRM